jgi:hypothetical protein
MPLLAEMATSDPITLVRQQALYALADVQDGYRLTGWRVPSVKLPAPKPLEALYPPRGLTWKDTAFPAPRRAAGPAPRDADALARYTAASLAPAHFRNLNMAQAAGAGHRMIARAEEARLAFAAWAGLPGDPARKALLAALDTPYPYAHYLAATALARRGERDVVPRLVRKLDASVKEQDTVGFWWCCEVLGQLGAKEALPVLAKHATAKNPPGTFGPEGMAVGYAAARTLARIAANPEQSDVARLLARRNVWLRAGALRGLAEADAPGIEALLRQAAGEDNPAVVRAEARVQLRRRDAKR